MFVQGMTVEVGKVGRVNSPSAVTAAASSGDDDDDDDDDV